MFKQLHDYVKQNYEDGNYQEAEEEYKNWSAKYDQAASANPAKKASDYQLGYEQATADFEQKHSFHHYPEKLVDFANQLTENKMQEITEFIKGYEDRKKELKTSKK
ncbi:MAG: hypothetical protein LKJ03_04190 [Enterococcaceae bacterium]|jgi:predicted S18 family serine protease|nr:hypothetical protein [Enterococcaceae bacterium]MCI1918849.1 hypothetical protein [Enterococcaceae bacterium]